MKYYHHPKADGTPRTCSLCPMHDYKPADHYHLDADGKAFACWKDCPDD